MKRAKELALAGLVAAVISFSVFAAPASAFVDPAADDQEQSTVTEQQDEQEEEQKTETQDSKKKTKTEENTPAEKEQSQQGTAIARDLQYDKETNKQFITIQDRDGNVFYLVIDYDSPVDEKGEQYQTYFLNPVDTDDLTALTGESIVTEEEPAVCTCTERCQLGAVDRNCELCREDLNQCVGKEKAVETPEVFTEPQSPVEEQSEANPAALILLIVLLGGGAFACVRLLKGKSQTQNRVNLDDYDYGEEPEEQDEPSLETETEGEECL